MSEEAPKKVWMRVNMAPKRLMEEKLFDDDVQYIRADIVEEMREALKTAAQVFRKYQDHHIAAQLYGPNPDGERCKKAERNREYAEQMEAALKLLEEEE